MRDSHLLRKDVHGPGESLQVASGASHRGYHTTRSAPRWPMPSPAATSGVASRRHQFRRQGPGIPGGARGDQTDIPSEFREMLAKRMARSPRGGLKMTAIEQSWANRMPPQPKGKTVGSQPADGTANCPHAATPDEGILAPGRTPDPMNRNSSPKPAEHSPRDTRTLRTPHFGGRMRSGTGCWELCPKDFDVEVYGVPWDRSFPRSPRWGRWIQVGKSFGLSLTVGPGETHDFSLPSRFQGGSGHRGFAGIARISDPRVLRTPAISPSIPPMWHPGRPNSGLPRGRQDLQHRDSHQCRLRRGS